MAQRPLEQGDRAAGQGAWRLADERDGMAGAGERNRRDQAGRAGAGDENVEFLMLRRCGRHVKILPGGVT